MKAKKKSLIFTDFETSSLLHKHHFNRVLGVDAIFSFQRLRKETVLNHENSLLPMLKYDLQLKVADVYNSLSLFME